MVNNFTLRLHYFASSFLGANAKNGDVRLASTDLAKGIVQVYYNGTWGTICLSFLSLFYGKTFQHVCQQLGFGSVSSTERQATKFSGYGPVLLNRVKCEGKELNIAECNNAGWKNVPQDCQDHSQDLYVSCLGNNYTYLFLFHSST